MSKLCFSPYNLKLPITTLTSIYSRYEALADTSDLHDDRLDEALQACGINISDYLSSELTTFDLDQVDVELKELRAQNDLAADVEALLRYYL